MKDDRKHQQLTCTNHINHINYKTLYGQALKNCFLVHWILFLNMMIKVFRGRENSAI